MSENKHDQSRIDSKFVDDGDGMKVTEPMHMTKEQIEAFNSSVDKILADSE